MCFRKEKDDSIQVFRAPLTPMKTRSKNKLDLGYTDSSGSEAETTLNNTTSPRKGRPKGSRNGSMIMYSPRPSRSRGSSGNFFQNSFKFCTR